MEQWEQWYREKQVDRTLEALKKNRFDVFFVPDRKAALDEVMKRIPDGATVSLGGSVTLDQIGVVEALKNRKITPVWPSVQAKTPEELRNLIQRSFATDVFLSSTNAITEDGKLYNVDATGNRVGAMVVGPKKVIVVSGVTKLSRMRKRQKNG